MLYIIENIHSLIIELSDSAMIMKKKPEKIKIRKNGNLKYWLMITQKTYLVF